MSIKKKMGLGIMAGALGVSLIGGGTWAAFNDVDGIKNSFAAGTLDLVADKESAFKFDIQNMKPGDWFTKDLVLENNGTLPINKIFLNTEKIGNDFDDKNELGMPEGTWENSEEDFLNQFSIVIKKEDGTEVYNNRLNNLLGTQTELTQTNDNVAGLDLVDKDHTFKVTIKFEEDNTLLGNGSRLHAQNKYQGEGTDLKFVFEATQMPGEDRSNN
jgi:spore coat-associated protein N